jgi:P2 family phage major capsid protein
MKNFTRTIYSQLLARIGTLNSVDNVTATFSVAPTIQQKLETAIQESSAFLKSINVIGVGEMEGEKLRLGVSGPVAGRTNTTNEDRKTRDLSGLKDQKYKCYKTDFDTHIPYAKLDAWAKFPDFQSRVANVIVQQQALDRIMIGFNGISAAATTNIATNPLLQDVNIGWLQQMRNEAPENVMNSGATPNKIKIGTTGDYKNLDAAVFDAITLLDPWFREDSNLVAIVGRELMHDKYFPLVNKDQAATETLASDIIISQKRLGGLQAVTVPFMPSNAILITRMDNLSIYFQEEARRRSLVDNPKRDRVENYESSNDAYVVEDFGMAALIENIEFVAAP